MKKPREAARPLAQAPPRANGRAAPAPAKPFDRAGDRGKGTSLLLCALLLVLCAAAFYRVTRNDLISLDDPSYVALNLHIQKGLTWDSLKWAFTTFETANWHPLTWLSHMLDYQLFGERVWGHHLTSLILHSLSTVALFLVLRNMTGALWRSLLVAALFGVHPLRVESVAWVAERKDVLSTLFFILTLLTYTRYVHGRQGLFSSGRDGARPGAARVWFWYALTFALFVLGLLSKPMMVTLPFVLLLLDFWPLKRFELQGRMPGFGPWFQLLLEKAPLFLLAAAACVVTLIAQRAGGVVVSSGGLALMARAENAVVSYLRYVGKIFWPVNLAVFYPLPDHWPAEAVLGAAVTLLAISALALWLWKCAPYLAVGWGWFLGTLVPVIGLIQVGHQAIADRYTYIPSIGLFLATVWGIGAIAELLSPALGGPAPGLFRRFSNSSALLSVGCGVLVVACVWMTRRQVGYWQDSESLFRHTLAVTENNAFIHDTLGLVLRIQGRLAEGTAEIRDAVRINPNYAGAWRDLGYNLVLQRNPSEGVPMLETALRLAPALPRTHKHLGAAFQQQGRLDEALIQLQDELKISPNDAETHHNLGAVLLGLGRLDDAIPQLNAALQLDPNYAEARNNLGIALCRKGNLPSGISQFEAALRLEPNYAQAHNNLGVALARVGRREEAIAQFKETLRIQPNYPGAEQQLGALTKPAP